MKKINLKIALWYIITLCIPIASCSREENEPQLSFSPENETLIANGINFSAIGGEQTVVFTPINQTYWDSWIKTDNNNTWCTVEYKYNFEFSKEVEANIYVAENTEYRERQAKLTIKVGNAQKDIIIKQKEKVDYLQLSEQQFEIDHISRNIHVEVNSNCDYTIDINQEDKSWIWNTEGEIKYHAGNRMITLYITDNNKSLPRECEITFKGEYLSKKIKVYQVAKPALNISEDETKVEVEIKEAGKLSNLLYTVDITKIKKLILKGYINGTDFITMKSMQNLTYLDLSEITIVTGGEAYQHITLNNKEIDYFTKDNEITDYLFFYWKKIECILLPKQVKMIGQFAFEGCSSLIGIDIPNSVTSMGYGVFCYCTALQHIHMSNSLTEIAEVAFGACIKLSTISIPKNVVKIDNRAFCNCLSLKEVHIEGKIRPVITPNSFTSDTEDYPYISPLCFILYVPKGCKEDYQNSSVWTTHAIELIEE